MSGPLTISMKHALGCAYMHGGRLTRHPGGFWTGPTLFDPEHPGRPLPYFGTSTVEALVSRGRMEYTAWQDGKRGRFPVEATVIP